ncbi:MAG: hypothetical protein IIA64_01990 [Planctomycetes bacterium]|nr:hypothetical protein [Planctomycetota bacterium]
MTRRVLLFIALTLGGIAPAAFAQTQPPPPPDQMHWAVKLGLRIEQVNRAFPVVDCVVLVPDAATYLDELGKWSPRVRWPVLFEDDQLAPMFIRRFQPSRVYRRESVGDLPKTVEQRQRDMEAVAIRAWGGDPQQDTLRQVFEREKYTPPGVVITSVDDPAWTAAVALAAGRGQPIAWLDGRFGRPNGRLTFEALNRLRSRIDRLVAQVGYQHADLGDDIDAITLCRAIAGRASASPNQNQDSTRAITDLLGRTPSGQRYAFTGWIYGDEVRCAYLAMCSLFLERKRVWLYNTYPTTPAWNAYEVTNPTATLNRAGYDATAFQGDKTTDRAWQNMLPGGIATDVLMMNTKGKADAFDLFTGRGAPGDVPVLNEPLVLHLIHSWSMRSPENPGTVGGQWIAHGVYAYVGSVHEPYLGAFVTPTLLAKRCMSYVPFLVAARVWDGPGKFADAWKINTLGDPLMLCAPPRASAASRLDPWGDHGLDLAEHVVTLLRRSESDNGSGEALADAIRTLNLLGRDDVAVQTWRLAQQRGFTTSAARPALGPLFRERQKAQFLQAWQELPFRDDLSMDMLWHLIAPSLGRSTSDQTLILLQAAVRRRQTHVDLERLAPHLIAAFGSAHFRGVIQREIEKAPNNRARTKLQALLHKY